MYLADKILTFLEKVHESLAARVKLKVSLLDSRMLPTNETDIKSVMVFAT